LGPLSLDLFTQHAKSLGYPYHLWNVAGKIQAYIVDPTGYGVQYNGISPDTDITTLPEYKATCKSNDGCTGQGFCKGLDFNTEQAGEFLAGFFYQFRTVQKLKPLKDCIKASSNVAESLTIIKKDL